MIIKSVIEKATGTGKTIGARAKREASILPVIWRGYSRRTAGIWYLRRQKDLKRWSPSVSKKIIQAAHREGFLYGTLKKYGIEDAEHANIISDFDYLALRPFNNSFSKWIDDILTTRRVLNRHAEHLPTIYFTIVQREGEQLILPFGGSQRKYTENDILALLREKGALELCPTFWKTKRKRYVLTYKRKRYFLDGIRSSQEQILRIIRRLPAHYVVTDPVSLKCSFDFGEELEHSLKLWIANDCQGGSSILAGEANVFWNEEFVINQSQIKERHSETVSLDVQRGSFVFLSQVFHVPDWAKICRGVLDISASLKQLNYYTMTICARPNGGFQVLHFSAYPDLPLKSDAQELHAYLKRKAAYKQEYGKVPVKVRMQTIDNSLFKKYVEKYCRPGIRPYMERIWIRGVKDDLLNTKGVSLSKKIWAWQNGFYSFRYWQYGLNHENYEEFLSDYNYCWLNRINNDYQKWVNDKTTFRIFMEPLKQYIPKCYYSVFKRQGRTELCRMPDCPDDFTETAEDLIALLKREKILAFKPSAGTHGDGFYCLQHEEGESFSINGKPCSEHELISVIESQKSFYIVSEYLQQHPFLNAIYPNSVNTIRIMVVNRHGYDPKIMQTYIRIGSSRTGFTDNVGYGGVCAMVDKDTGEIYLPQTIKQHVFYDCPVHPDTGTPIAGVIPHWDEIREVVLMMAMYLGELEYLGFDMALTETGPCVLEINIHQDLHKVAMFSDEMKEFFQRKIELKKKQYHIQ